MDDWIYGLAVATVAAAFLFAVRTAPGVRDLVWLALGAHLLAAPAQVYLTRDYYGGGDMLAYFEVGRALAQLIQLDPGTYLPEVTRYMFWQQVSLPVGQAFEGSSTASMAGISAFVLLATGGSLYAACLAVASLAFFSKLAVCQVLWWRMGRVHHRRIAFALLLLPSAVYWSSGLLKEALAVSGLGFLIFGAYLIYRRDFVKGSLISVPAALTVGLIKAYLLFPLGCAAAVWLYFVVVQAEDRERVVPVKASAVIPASLLAIVVVILLGRVFPEYAVDRLAEEAATYQEVGGWQPGGSSFSLGDPRATSFQAQLAFVPLAVLGVLFRPLPFEINGITSAMNAVETTALLVATIVIVTRRRWKALVARVLSHPELAFCVVLTLTAAVGIGLTTSNLGTLSRYRMPVMPFFAFLMMSLIARERPARRRASDIPLPGPSRALLEQAWEGREGVRRT